MQGIEEADGHARDRAAGEQSRKQGATAAPCLRAAAPRTQCARRKQVYVKRWAPELSVVPTLAIVHDSSEITEKFVEGMPREYVVKGAHGAGMVILVKGDVARSVVCSQNNYKYGCLATERSAHAKFIAETCRVWLLRDYGKVFGETHYSHVRRGCVFEGSLLDAQGESPRDVKVMVTHGEPLFVMDVANRYGIRQGHTGSNHSSTRHVLLDTAGRVLPGSYQGMSQSGQKTALREYRVACTEAQDELQGRASSVLPTYGAGQFDALLRYSRTLATAAAELTGHPLKQLRVDFFVNTSHTFFAELTFFTAACMGVGPGHNYTFVPSTLDYLLGHIASTPVTTISPACVSAYMRRSCLEKSRG
jgi:hypothetical protein